MNKEEYWEYDSSVLCLIFKYKFDIWWDTDKFDWKESSWALIEYLPDKFDIWWDSEKFNYENYYSSNCLCEYLPHKFDTWWNSDKFNWEHTNTYNIVKCVLHKITNWYKPEFTDINDIIEYINSMEWDYD